jgi:hypothetical protein
MITFIAVIYTKWKVNKFLKFVNSKKFDGLNTHKIWRLIFAFSLDLLSSMYRIIEEIKIWTSDKYKNILEKKPFALHSIIYLTLNAFFGKNYTFYME